MVVMSIEQYEELQTMKRIDAALLEAQQQAENSPIRYGFEGVSAKLRKKLADKVAES